MTKNPLSASELLVLGIEMERKHYGFYEAVAAGRGTDVQQAFMKFAKQGRENEHKFRDLLTDVGGYQPGQACVNTAYLMGIADSSVYAGQRLTELTSKATLSDMEAVDAAMLAEKDSILFYTEARGLVPENDVKVIDEIINQAKDRISELNYLVNKLKEAPALLKA